MISDHKTLRRVLQWAFPGALMSMREAWDGAEDKQAYLDRAATWSGSPVSAAQIEAKEADYLANTSAGPVPQSVTPFKACQALRAAGLYDTVVAWVATQDDTMQDAWNRALAFERNDPLILAACAALGITSAQRDDLFRLAASL